MRITLPRTYTAADPYLAAIETCLNVPTFDCAYLRALRDALMGYYLVLETQDRSSHVEAINQISSAVDAIVMGEEVESFDRVSLAVLWGRKYHRMLVLPFMMGITLYICTEYAMADSTTAWMTFVVVFTLGFAVILGYLTGWAAGIHFRSMLEDEQKASEEDKSAENDE